MGDRLIEAYPENAREAERYSSSESNDATHDASDASYTKFVRLLFRMFRLFICPVPCGPLGDLFWAFLRQDLSLSLSVLPKMEGI